MAAKILVVDDEPSVLAVVSRALRDEGHEVIAVSNGQTAYDVTLNEAVDVVVTNNRMPDLNGGELVSALRKHLPGIPILHLDELSQATHSLFQLPADVPTLFKPFDLVALKAAVHRLLRPPPPIEPGFATAL
jgi:two-component system, cell cycle response regulator CpdR